MKVLVTGVKGQLGFDVVNELKKRGHTPIGVDVDDMDITDAVAVEKVITDAAPDAVIHCAAYTAVDKAEDNEEICRKVNAYGTENIAKVCFRRITAAIDEYLQGHLTEEHPKKAAMGDEVVLDFEGFVNGVPFEGGKAEEYPLLLGSGYFIPGFEEQVAGMAVGDERDIPVTFPTQYAPELAGKDAVFHIKVHKITRRARPVMSEEFAKSQGFADASALRRSIMEQAVRNKQQEAADAYADALVQQVIEGMEVEIPERMVTCQLDGLMHDLEQQLMQQGATMDAYLEMAGITREDLRRQAEASARASVEFELAMTEIARLEDIRFTDAELEEKYTQMSALYGMTPEQLKQNLPIERLTHDLRLARARAIVVDSAKPL